MKIYKSIFILFCTMSFTLFNISLKSQSGKLSGRVIDEDGYPLIGANIILQGTLIGTSTDGDGNFSFSDLETGIFVLEISMLGFKKFLSEEITLNEKEQTISITLVSAPIQYDPVVISAGKHKQNLTDLPVSASLIGSDKIRKKNITKIDEVLRYSPGVHVTLDQISIRGSGGFSRGAGTRVLLTLDGLPLSTGDTGEIVWEMLPVTDIERIEIIKGASSALYGSAAIGGVVNIISKQQSSNPVTTIKNYFGVYDKPAHSEWEWENSFRHFNGQTITHSNSIKKLGYTLSISRIENLGYKQNDDVKRFSGFVKTSYNISDYSKLSLIAAGYTHDRGVFNFWKDSRNALTPPDADLGARVKSDRIIGGLIYSSIINKRLSINAKASLYNNFWKEKLGSENSSSSGLYRFEFQNNYQLFNNTLLISGIETSLSDVSSTIFGSPSANTFGAYLQAEQKINNISITGGLRYDFSKIKSLDSKNNLSPKLGVNVKLSNTTVLRAFAGAGFRAPTLAETFTATTASGIQIKPNLDLKAEKNYSFETGISTKPLEQVNFDGAIFINEFYDLIEPSLTSSGSNTFIQFRNVVRARIIGTDLSTTFFFPQINSNLKISYTYLWARDVDNKTALKYRPRNSVYIEAGYNLGSISVGFDLRYLSKVEEVDKELTEANFVRDGDERVEVFVADFNFGYSLFHSGIPANLNLNINNIFNYNYVEVIANISPIRNISLTLELLF